MNVIEILKDENANKLYVCNNELFRVKRNPSGAISLVHNNGIPLLLNNINIAKDFTEAKC